MPLRRKPLPTSALLALLALSLAAPVRAAMAEIDPATGYRVTNYRAPVTLPPVGGDRIDLAGVDRLRKEGAVLVDVMPARAGYDPATGKWRLVEKRADIPHSIWLPNTGAGKLEPRLAAYFAGSLQGLTAGNLGKPLIIYCMADCWMSWNAVKRASALGYSSVHWFADGTDGWTEAGRELVEADPPSLPALPDSHRDHQN